MNKHKISTLLSTLCLFSLHQTLYADTRPAINTKLKNTAALTQVVDQNRLLNVYTKLPDFTQLKEFKDQPATEASEDKEPSGPDVNAPPVHLADVYESKSRHVQDDFVYQIAYSDKLIRDHSSLNTYYFYPSGYFLKYSTGKGYELDFLHRTREEESGSDLIVMTFTIAPRQTPGSLQLITELASAAVEPANKKPVSLKRLPISSARVSMSSLSSMIPEENLKIINSPQDVGDEIRVQAIMNQSQKEDVVASIRSGGLSGDIAFKTNNNQFEIVIPYYVNFTDYAGDWISDITKLKTSESLTNTSPFPLAMSGVVAYTKKSNKVERHFVSLADPVVMSPGAKATADTNYDQLFTNKGSVIATWAAYDKVACDACINKIEQAVLVSPGVASRSKLAIEAIPNIFSEFSLFKVLIEVRSKHFSSAGDFEEVKSVTLRAEESQAELTLYINRDKPTKNIFEYRIKPYHSDGAETKQSSWIKGESVSDITITKRDIEPLMSASN